VIRFDLIGIGACKLTHRLIQTPRRSDIAGNHRRAARPRMSLGEQMTQDPRVIRQCSSLERVERDCALHVSELTDEVRPVLDRRPPQERIAHRLHGLLVFDHSLSLMGVPWHVTVHVRSHDRPARFLQLQKEDIVVRASLQQCDVASQSDAADTDDLMSDVDQRVATNHATPVRRERAQIVVDGRGNPLERGPWNARDQGWPVDNVVAAAELGRESRQCAVARSGARQPRARAIVARNDVPVTMLCRS
jgi:hypothetical protein